MGVINQLDDGFGISIGGGGSAPFVGLLDTYSGAAAAYSVRLLSSTYTGALVEIRRSSDNALKSFYPDTNNELSLSSEDGAGTSLSSWIGSDNGYVRTWYDQSGNSNDATQTSASGQPIIINSGSLVLSNSKPTLQSIDVNTSLLTAYVNINSERSYFIVAERKGAQFGSYHALILQTSASFFQVYAPTNTLTYYNGAVKTGTSFDLAQQLITVSQEATSGVFRKNAVNMVANVNTPGGAVNRPIQLFKYASNALNGCLSEVIVYNTSQSANVSGIEANINDYFTIY